jgi:hypothetical protein
MPWERALALSSEPEFPGSVLYDIAQAYRSLGLLAQAEPLAQNCHKIRP